MPQLDLLWTGDVNIDASFFLIAVLLCVIRMRHWFIWIGDMKKGNSSRSCPSCDISFKFLYQPSFQMKIIGRCVGRIEWPREVRGFCSFCLINFAPRLLITPESKSFRRKPIRPAKAVYKRQSSVREHRACQLLRGIGWAHIWTSHGRLCHSLICYGLATSISTLRSFWLRSCCA